MEVDESKRKYFMDLMNNQVQMIDKNGAIIGAVDQSGTCYEGGWAIHRAIDESEASFEGLRDRFRVAALKPPVMKEEYETLFKQYEICLRLVEKVEKVAEKFKYKRPLYSDVPVNHAAVIMSERSIVRIEKEYREWAANARSNYFSSWKWKGQTSTLNRYDLLQESYKKELCGKVVDK